MPVFGPIESHISCNGTTLPEYSVQGDPMNPLRHIRSCWIESETNKTFQIECQWTPLCCSGCDWDIRVVCDGIIVNSNIVKSQQGRVLIQGAVVGTAVHSLLFADLKLKDNGVNIQTGINPALGPLIVQFWRINPHSWRAIPKPAINYRPINLGPTEIQEGKQALSGHRTQIGAMIPNVGSNMTVMNVCNLDRAPFVEFVFYYRPKAMLQAMGHIPTPPAAPSLGVKRGASEAFSGSDEEDGASDEAQEIVAAIAALHGRLNKIKKRKRVKVEELPVMILSGTKGTSKDEPIDLTGDDEVVVID